MDVWYYVIIWLVLAGVFAYVELETVALISIWFTLGALVAAIVAALNIELTYQIVAFSLTSLLTLGFIKIFFPGLTLKTDSTPNDERLIGLTLEVVESISPNKPGLGKLDGVLWTIVTHPNKSIQEGQMAKIISIKGNKLLVELEKGI